MKKILKLIIALILTISLVACSGGGATGDGVKTGSGSAKGMNGDIEVTIKIDGDKITEIDNP